MRLRKIIKNNKAVTRGKEILLAAAIITVTVGLVSAEFSHQSSNELSRRSSDAADNTAAQIMHTLTGSAGDAEKAKDLTDPGLLADYNDIIPDPEIPADPPQSVPTPKYEVTFYVYNNTRSGGEDGETPLENADVYFNEENKTTDKEGYAVFLDVEERQFSYSWSVMKDGYLSKTGNVEVTQDMEIIVELVAMEDGVNYPPIIHFIDVPYSSYDGEDEIAIVFGAIVEEPNGFDMTYTIYWGDSSNTSGSASPGETVNLLGSSIEGGEGGSIDLDDEENMIIGDTGSVYNLDPDNLPENFSIIIAPHIYNINANIQASADGSHYVAYYIELFIESDGGIVRNGTGFLYDITNNAGFIFNIEYCDATGDDGGSICGPGIPGEYINYNYEQWSGEGSSEQSSIEGMQGFEGGDEGGYGRDSYHGTPTID